MRKNGFTLIELLAVIVILAIIALIATPIVLNIIEDSKISSSKRSIDNYANAVKYAVANSQLTNPTGKIKGTFTTENGKKLIGNIKLTVDYDGDVVCDTIEVYSDGSVYLENCKVNGESVDYTYGTKQIPPPVSFEEDSWETIAKAVREGNISAYNVGDTKEIKLKGFNNLENIEGTYTIRIANKKTAPKCSDEDFSKTACGFVIEFVDIIIDKGMNTEITNVNGWNESTMKIYVNDTIYNALPKKLKDNIIDTKVVSGHGSTEGETNFITTDKIYLLSTREVWGEKDIGFDTAKEETRQLDYYENNGVTLASCSGAIKNYNGNANNWWLRTARSNTDIYFYVVNSSGSWDINYANTDYGVAPAFRIG